MVLKVVVKLALVIDRSTLSRSIDICHCEFWVSTVKSSSDDPVGNGLHALQTLVNLPGHENTNSS